MGSANKSFPLLWDTNVCWGIIGRINMVLVSHRVFASTGPKWSCSCWVTSLQANICKAELMTFQMQARQTHLLCKHVFNCPQGWSSHTTCTSITHSRDIVSQSSSPSPSNTFNFQHNLPHNVFIQQLWFLLKHTHTHTHTWMNHTISHYFVLQL